jgi:hypothetical protein
VGPVGEVALGGRDAIRTGQTQEGHHEVTQASHHLRAVTFAHLAAVFVKGDVAHVVQAVLDDPMASGEREKLSGGGLVSAAAGQAANDFALDLDGLAGAAVLADALDLEDLLAVREGGVVVELGGGPDAAGVDASMSFVGGLSLRGG